MTRPSRDAIDRVPANSEEYFSLLRSVPLPDLTREELVALLAELRDDHVYARLFPQADDYLWILEGLERQVSEELARRDPNEEDYSSS